MGLPARLLEMRPLRGSEYVTLVETADLEPSACFITLSHCWGKALPLKLLQNLYETFLDGIPVKELPRTFRDAIAFTRALKIRYLWIDALCIIQDSHDDWIREALFMSSIYTQSWLNLAATSSTDSNGGLFNPRDWRLSAVCAVTATWQGFAKGQYYIVDHSAWGRRVNDSPLNRRAWVFQERLLAPRTVHFAYDQIWWECRKIRSSEIFPHGIPERPVYLGRSQIYEREVIKTFTDLDPDDVVDCNEKWLSWVTEYTRMDLTKDTDKLVAIAGLAIYIQSLLGWSPADYLAGLWNKDIIVDLLWRVAKTGVKIPIYVAPSWSWASVKGEIYFHDPDSRTLVRNNLAVELLDASTTPIAGALGPVSDGSLTIKGPLHRIDLSAPNLSVPEYPSFEKIQYDLIEISNSSSFEVSLDDDTWYRDWDAKEHNTYFCEFMTTPTPHLAGDFMSEGLILESTGSQRCQHRRIGWLRLFAATQERAMLDGKYELDSSTYLTGEESGLYTFTIV